MKIIQKTNDLLEREKIQKSWKKRIEDLPISAALFCENHDIDKTMLSRYKHMHIRAGWEWVKKIEKALLKESQPKKKIK